MSKRAWYSQLFDNDGGGGVLFALPYDGFADWRAGDDYEEVIDVPEECHFRPVGSTLGLILGDLDGEGVGEAHWMRLEGQSGVTLVLWSSWDDPARPTIPEDMKKVHRAWQRHADPRQPWLEERLGRDGLDWQRLDQTQDVPSGVLLLMHAEWPASKTKLARPNGVAKCGQAVPVGLAPGPYWVETVIVNEQPEGTQACALYRWSPAG
jgi:hypothetical protein